MPQTTVNPYGEIGGQMTPGLNAIIAALPGSPGIDDLVNAVYGFIQPIYYPAGGGSVPTQIEIELKSMLRTAINSYVNNYVFGGQAGYNAAQLYFINMLIGNSLTSNLPLVSISDQIADVEDNLTNNQLTVTDQTALLLATTIGINVDQYWNTVIGGTTGWNTYITGALQPLGSDIAYWVAAAMNGALAAYAATPAGMVEPSVNFVTTKMVAALGGALICTAGKVIFNWRPRIQHVNPMINLGSGPIGFGGGEGDGSRHRHGPILTDYRDYGNQGSLVCLSSQGNFYGFYDATRAQETGWGL